MMQQGNVFDIKRFSIHDGPGIRTTVFLKGCPLHCLWCHNPESQNPYPEIMLFANRCILCEACLSSCPENAISWNGVGLITDRSLCIQCGICTESCYADAREIVGKSMTVTEVIEEIEKDSSFFDESGGGVTFSGGEPLLQYKFLHELLRECKEREFHTAVDTSGAASWKSFAMILPYVDLFLYDLKNLDPLQHKLDTGVSNKRILQNLERLSNLGKKVIIRIAVIPGHNDSEVNIRKTAEFAANLPSVQGISLLPYHESAAEKYRRLGREYTIGKILAPSEDRLADIARVFNEYGLEPIIGR